MARLNGSIDLDIPCPGCGHKNKVAVRTTTKPSTTNVVCGGCRRPISVDASKFQDGMREVERVLKDFERSFK